MSDRPRELLRLLVCDLGEAILDARRCEGLLNDHLLGAFRKERFTLVLALKEGIVDSLWQARRSAAVDPEELLFGRLATPLLNLGFSEDITFWAIETWAYAIDVAFAHPAPLVRAQDKKGIQPGRVVLNNDETFSSIGEALERAEHGANIRIKPGIYQEALRLRKSVKIIGDGLPGDIILEMPAGLGIEMKIPVEVSLSNVTIRSSGDGERLQPLIHVDRGTLTLSNAIVENATGVAIYVAGSAAHANMHTVTLDADSGQIVHIGQDSTCLIDECAFTGGTTAVLTEGSNKAELRKCTFLKQKGASVHLERASSNTIEQCQFSHSEFGIRVAGQSQIGIDHCEFHNIVEAAIHFSEHSSGTVRSTDAHHCNYGIFVSDCAGPIIEKCSVYRQSNAGIRIERSQVHIIACQVFENSYCGIYLSENSTCEVRSSKVESNAREAFQLWNSSTVNVRDSTLAGNASGLYRVEEGSAVQIH